MLDGHISLRKCQIQWILEMDKMDIIISSLGFYDALLNINKYNRRLPMKCQVTEK